MKKHGNKDKEKSKKLTHPQTNYKKHCSNTHAPSLYMTTIAIGFGFFQKSQRKESVF